MAQSLEVLVLNKNSHPAVVEQDCPGINSSQRWCLCKNAHVVWSHRDLGSSRSYQAGRRTTSYGNGWHATTTRQVQCNWNKASLLRDGKTWEPTILSSQTTLWTMQIQRKTFRLGRRPAEQGPRRHSINHGEKSVTGLNHNEEHNDTVAGSRQTAATMQQA